ncbi:MAG TPA: hypothetical protein VEX64_07975 [Pyrinomonadaceae bacterium]|nr:hypothetical protein [Pyrinomonadaceae bacterium]
MKRKLIFVFVLLVLSAQAVRAQNPPEVTVSLNEQFLNSFLDAVFINLQTPTFQLAEQSDPKPEAKIVKAAKRKNECAQSITILREMNGVKTAVRFAEGKILAPLAFSGNYDMPFVGCTAFRGVAEANINLEYDREKQILFGRVKVQKVDLNGVPGIASGVVGRFVQGSIDKKINPLEILRGEQVSAIVPVQYANGSIRLKAVNMQPEIAGNILNVRVAFEFSKAN